MREIRLDAARWNDKEDFYEDFLRAVQAPAWHGHNLDALNDSIGMGEINGIEVPYRVVIEHEEQAGPDARVMIEKFAQMVNDLSRNGCQVELVRMLEGV